MMLGVQRVIVVGVFIAFAPLNCASSSVDLYDNNHNGENESQDPQYSHTSMLCMDIQPQHALDIEQIEGTWYGNEIIKHTVDIPGIYQYDSCVIIRLNDVTEKMRQRYNSYRHTSLSYMSSYQRPESELSPHARPSEVLARYMRLIWSESDDHLEYTFNYTATNPGLWTNVGEQRGSLAALDLYIQFSGSVQVLKAAPDQLVLTFCGSDIKSSIYTIVLSRQSDGLPMEELRGIRNLLYRRGLSTETIRKVCKSNGTPTLASLELNHLLLLAILIAVRL